MANYILRTLLTTFPLPITLWGASGHRSDQTDLFISTRSLSQQADRIFLPPNMTPTAYHIYCGPKSGCAQVGLEGKGVGEKGSGAWWGKVSGEVKASFSHDCGQNSPPRSVHTGPECSGLFIRQQRRLPTSTWIAIHQKCASLSVVEPIIMKQTRN